MKKITKSDLKGLTEKFFVLTGEQQRSVVGGVTQDQCDSWYGNWPGGYVDGWGWVAPEVTDCSRLSTVYYEITGK
jgi:hypothetical protein